MSRRGIYRYVLRKIFRYYSAFLVNEKTFFFTKLFFTNECKQVPKYENARCASPWDAQVHQTQLYIKVRVVHNIFFSGVRL